MLIYGCVSLYVNMGRFCRGNMGFKCEQFSQCEKLNPCQGYQIHARASALLQHSRRYVRLKQSCYRHGQVCFSGVYCV